MIYTSYLGKLKKIKEKLPDAKVVVIMRYPPKWLYSYINDSLWIDKRLAPTEKTFSIYKENKDFSIFSENYMQDLKRQKSAINDYIEKNNYVDYVFLCCEIDDSICHRSLLRQYFESLGLPSEELML